MIYFVLVANMTVVSDLSAWMLRGGLRKGDSLKDISKTICKTTRNTPKPEVTKVQIAFWKPST